MRTNLLDTVQKAYPNMEGVIRFELPYASRRALAGRRSLPDKLPVLLETYRSVVDTLIRHVQYTI